MKTKSIFSNSVFLRKFLIFWTIFIGVGAVWGCAMMLIDPSGEMWEMDPLLEGLQMMPCPEIFFTNFIFSGIVLLMVNGVTQFFTTLLLFKKNKFASRFGIVCGVILILWILLQILIIWEPNPLSNIYLIIGVLETLTAILLYRKEKQLVKK